MTDQKACGQRLKKPAWLRVRVGQGETFARTDRLVHAGNLHTVCEEALCPNRGECWHHGHATLMILGDTCTRACRFCNVKTGRSGVCDPGEPQRAAEAVRKAGLREIVLTSVTRDDLPDGGAAVWAETIRRVRDAVPGGVIEVLIPDFGGNWDALRCVLEAGPDVLGHNLETVPSLYPAARSRAVYARSLDVLQRAKQAGLITKTAIMLGLGETEAEVLSLLKDVRGVGCDILYIGHYLQPSKEHLEVVRYVEPVEFDAYRQAGLEMGFPVVVSAPLVRSSYHTKEQSDFVQSRRGRKASTE